MDHSFLPENIKHLVPKGGLAILVALQNAGFKAYFVGGWVRDFLMNRDPKDFDVATSARPEDVKRLFKKTFDTGIQHGTVKVLGAQSLAVEVTTFRTDGAYSDKRRPDSVTFSDDLTADLSRRDFTINAMAWNPTEGLLDPFGGRADIESGTIRTVGDPALRFQEDALRMLRAVRFSAVLDFAIEPTTANAIKTLAPSLTHISAERIRDELSKLLLSHNPEQIMLLHTLGMREFILPDVVNGATCAVLAATKNIFASEMEFPVLVLRLAILLCELGSPEAARAVLRDLRFDNKTIHAVTQLILFHEMALPKNELMLRKALHLMELTTYELFLVLKYVQKACSRADFAMQHVLLEKVVEEEQCYSLAQLAVNGADLIQLGFSGPSIGTTLDALLDAVIAKPSLNTKGKLLKMATDLKT
ncbi:MAG: CCA tRNA nucleotidyltransferase [Clostridia bacterium]